MRKILLTIGILLFADFLVALAMERYLLSEGIPGDIIIKEEKSTST